MFRKNTAGQFLGFPAINASTGATMTGTTGFSAYRVIDGAAQASATGTVTDKGNGQYSFALSQADTNGNDISILFTMTGMVAVEKTFVTTVCDPTSTAFGLSLAKTTNITGFNDVAATAIVSGGAITTSSGAVSTVSTVTNGVGIGAGAISSGSFAASAITAAAIATSALNGKGDWLLASGYTVPPTSAVIAAATWDLATSGHTTSGTFGAAMNAAGSAVDPWATNLPGAYGTGTAGNLVGTNLNATVASRSTYAGADTAGTTTLLGRIGGAITISGGGVNLNLSQTGLTPRAVDAVADASLTVGDALVAALCGAAGKEQVSGTSYAVKTPSTGTTIRTFTLDSATTPTQRS